jgi:hypothetical protein
VLLSSALLQTPSPELGTQTRVAWTSESGGITTLNGALQTKDMASAAEQVAQALENMRLAQPPVPFAGRWHLLPEQRHGGQAVVQFARGANGGFEQRAIKLFTRSEDFAIEQRWYMNAAIHKTLPKLVGASDNADGSVRSITGMPFPPFMILERGTSLAECASGSVLADCFYRRRRGCIRSDFGCEGMFVLCEHKTRMHMRDRAWCMPVRACQKAHGGCVMYT